MIYLENSFSNDVNTGKPEERDFIPDSIPTPPPVKK